MTKLVCLALSGVDSLLKHVSYPERGGIHNWCLHHLVRNDTFTPSSLCISNEVDAGDNFISNLNESSNMGDDGDEHERPRQANRRGMNYFGSILLVSSSSIIFTPLLENFPSLAPNGWEILIWLAWGYAIFAYSIIFLIVNNVFRFLENKKPNLFPSHTNRNWLKNLKTPGLSLLIWFVLIIVLWNIPV